MPGLSFFENTIDMDFGSKLQVRSTLVELRNGHRILISPLNFTDKQLTDLKQKTVHSLVAPNCFHHLFVKKTAENLAITNIFAAPGLCKKRPDIAWSSTIDSKTWSYTGELDMLFIEGAPLYNECVFFHRDSKTLIVTDLLFNFKNLSLNFKNFIFKLMGTFNKPACSRLVKLLTFNKKKMKNSLLKLLEFDFEHIVMAHGEIISVDAKQIFTAALKERNLI